MDKPLVLHFTDTDIPNLARLEAKIKFLQRAADIMLPGKHDGIIEQVEVIEAFETSKFEGVFREAKSGEPEIELQHQITHNPDFAITEPAYLLMRNTMHSRRHALSTAHANMLAGKPLFTADDTYKLQGIIYDGFNQLSGFESPLQKGHILTGAPRECMVGDKNFRTAHPKVLKEFMQDWESLMASDLAKSLHPIIFAFVASFAFVQVHPVEDGNGRVSRQILEAVICCSDDGKFDLRNMVAVSNSEYKPAMINTYAGTKPDMGGNVNLKHYLGKVGQLFEQSIDDAFKRMNVQFPEIRR